MTFRRSCGFAMTTLGIGVGVFIASPGFAQGNPERNAYFGQTHVHTSWSFDAYVFGNTVTGPEDAYKYALGQPIKHPGGYLVQLKRPLDFEAATDHAEYVGTLKLANDPGSTLSKLPVAEKLKVRNKDDIQNVYLFLGMSLLKKEPIKDLIDPAVAGDVWKQTVAIADKYYQPGKFTTFAAYEWSSTPNNRNLHRNVIFKDTKKVPDLPFSSIDSENPEDLWVWMNAQRKAGNELLAISHNSNLSDGIMFPLDVDNKGRPIDAAWAQDRMNNEPLAEISQLKGASETHPSLSPNDEFASFEILTYLLGGSDRPPKLHGSYIREAYQNGVAMQDARGYNPYKFGVVGASDTHDTAAAYSQSNYFGGHGLLDATPQARLSGKKESGLAMNQLSVSGLGGVWAEQNTRESIFAAMQRKETYGTSPPLINRIWNEGDRTNLSPFAATAEATEFVKKVHQLQPNDDSKRALQAQVLSTASNVEQVRVSLFTQSHDAIPAPFLAILMFWLAIIFTSFGLFVRPNLIVIVTFFVGALSVSSAILLILEMGRPFAAGLMQISSEALRHALAPLGS